MFHPLPDPFGQIDRVDVFFGSHRQVDRIQSVDSEIESRQLLFVGHRSQIAQRYDRTVDIFDRNRLEIDPAAAAAEHHGDFVHFPLPVFLDDVADDILAFQPRTDSVVQLVDRNPEIIQFIRVETNFDIERRSS